MNPVWRETLLCVGWGLSSIALYAGCLGLDVYWNLAQWRPKTDLSSGLTILWIVVSLAVLGLLARASRGGVAKWVGLVVSLGLLSAGVYAAFPEALSEGLFARDTVSPAWYRLGRLVVMGLPGVMWVLGRGHKDKAAAEAVPE